MMNLGILPDNASCNPTAEMSKLNASTFENALTILRSIAPCIPNNPPVIASTDFIKEKARISAISVEIKPKKHCTKPFLADTNANTQMMARIAPSTANDVQVAHIFVGIFISPLISCK